MADGRMGVDAKTAESAAWLSGGGIAQTMMVETVSDALAGKDTVVGAARAWLEE